MLLVPLVRDCEISNQFGVPKGPRIYVDAANPRNNRDRGLRLLLADGGFDAGAEHLTNLVSLTPSTSNRITAWLQQAQELR